MKTRITYLVLLMFSITTIVAQNVPDSREKTIVASFEGQCQVSYYFKNVKIGHELVFVKELQRKGITINPSIKNYEIKYLIQFKANETEKSGSGLDRSIPPFIRENIIVNVKELPAYVELN